MKHNVKVTLFLVLFYIAAQVVGLFVINQYIDHPKTSAKNEIVTKPLPYGMERPQVENKSSSFIIIVLSILIGTGLIFVLIRFNKPSIWKFMFFISILTTLTIAFGAFVNYIMAGIAAFIISVWRLYRPNLIVQNSTEIFIYGGLAAFFVNIFNVISVVLLLITISVYDYVSVYKTKHMIKLAAFQSKSKVFAGFFIPYNEKKILMSAPSAQIKYAKKESKGESKAKAQSGPSIAVLGGGDIGFTLIFAGVVMQDLVLRGPAVSAFLKTLIIPICSAIALTLLLFKGEKNRFYPAMPALTIGCLVGLLIIKLVS